MEVFAVEPAAARPGAPRVFVDEEPTVEELYLEDGTVGDVVGGDGTEVGDEAFELCDDVVDVHVHFPVVEVQPM
jgi:hypothetical protein